MTDIDNTCEHAWTLHTKELVMRPAPFVVFEDTVDSNNPRITFPAKSMCISPARSNMVLDAVLMCIDCDKTIKIDYDEWKIVKM